MTTPSMGRCHFLLFIYGIAFVCKQGKYIPIHYIERLEYLIDVHLNGDFAYVVDFPPLYFLEYTLVYHAFSLLSSVAPLFHLETLASYEFQIRPLLPSLPCHVHMKLEVR